MSMFNAALLSPDRVDSFRKGGCLESRSLTYKWHHFLRWARWRAKSPLGKTVVQKSRDAHVNVLCEKMGRDIRVISCFPDRREGLVAESALQEACKDLGLLHQRVVFDKLDFGETSTVDLFYSADVVVADITELSRRNGLFYHLAIRESFENTNNIVTVLNSSESYRGARRGSGSGPPKTDMAQMQASRWHCMEQAAC